jgi:type I restriction enzyme S subunit
MANSNNNAITWNSVNGLNGMKDSLPEGWHLATIADLFDIQQGKALSPKAKEGISPKPFLRTANVLWGHLDLTNVDEMDFSDEEVNRLELKKGDLLVCEGGDIGRTAMWEGQLSICMYQNHIHRLRKKVWDIDPTFFMFWMQSAITQQGLYAGEGNKTTIPNLSKAD